MELTLLAIADRPPRRSVHEVLAEHSVDLIVTLGDLSLFDIQELQTITDIPKLGVYGNHDSGNYMSTLGITNLHLQTAELRGIRFGGFEGSVRYKQDPTAPMMTQEEALIALSDFPPVDVMLAHAPPRGIHDEDEPAHQGFDALREYVLRCAPRYLLHGHTYPATNETELGRTTVRYIHEDEVLTLTFPEPVHGTK